MAPRNTALELVLPSLSNSSSMVSKDELNRVWILRKVLAPLSPVETMELLLDKLGKTSSNAVFLGAMSG